MPERDHDPIASTQVFRAFVQRDHSEPGRRRGRAVILSAILAVLVLAVIVGVLIAR